MTDAQRQVLMRRAIALSRENVQRGGGPFGAVIVKAGAIVGEAFQALGKVAGIRPQERFKNRGVRQEHGLLERGVVLRRTEVREIADQRPLERRRGDDRRFHRRRSRGRFRPDPRASGQLERSGQLLG